MNEKYQKSCKTVSLMLFMYLRFNIHCFSQCWSSDIMDMTLSIIKVMPVLRSEFKKRYWSMDIMQNRKYMYVYFVNKLKYCSLGYYASVSFQIWQCLELHTEDHMLMLDSPVQEEAERCVKQCQILGKDFMQFQTRVLEKCWICQ